MNRLTEVKKDRMFSCTNGEELDELRGSSSKLDTAVVFMLPKYGSGIDLTWGLWNKC